MRKTANNWSDSGCQVFWFKLRSSDTKVDSESLLELLVVVFFPLKLHPEA